jgi:hypothetical protein
MRHPALFRPVADEVHGCAHHQQPAQITQVSFGRRVIGR